MKQLGTGEQGLSRPRGPLGGGFREQASGRGCWDVQQHTRVRSSCPNSDSQPCWPAAATALNAASSEGPLVPWEPPDFSTMQRLKGQCLAERSAYALWVGEYSDHHPWLEDPPVQVQEKPPQRPTSPALPFRSHVTSSTWGSGLLLPLHPPPHPTTPAVEGPLFSPRPAARSTTPKHCLYPRGPLALASMGTLGAVRGTGNKEGQGNRPRVPASRATGPTLSDMRVAMERPSS